eukprot:Gregarina_sp_Poly_1__468@NODE_1111_length_5059_cov_113_669471_g770_i0_p2_GENE_NODE_1111_length_5059_cov_113_669471_g770_i0NODE_1111_length_5059_cov_113_669471_g770_i0_p2_ORF_typecomplete_len150_score13_95_NODE_1111_length_5059_cov_113_669471_g770_i06681117
MGSHAKLCSRSAAKTKKRRKGIPNFAALELPRANDRTRLKDYITGLVASAKSVADEFETVLAQQGMSVARGGSRDCIGYPIPLCPKQVLELGSEGTDSTMSSEMKQSPPTLRRVSNRSDNMLFKCHNEDPNYECDVLYCHPPMAWLSPR